MKEEILISVIIPVYQVEEYLARCVESVRNQSYQKLEIILVDDGSKDRSGEICESYACQDERIRVFHKPNGGLSDARNYGIDRARGEYLAFVDSDDFVAYDFIEILLKNCLENQCEISVCDFERVTGNRLADDGKRNIRVYSKVEALSELCENNGNHVLMTVAWNKLYKKDLFDGIRYPVGKLHEDEATTYKLIDRTSGIAVTAQKLYGYYMSPSSIMRSDYHKKRLDIVGILLERMQYFHDKGQFQLEIKVKNQLSYTLIYHYYNVKRYIKDSVMTQKKLLKCFERYCVKDIQFRELPVGTRINNILFFRFTKVYYMLFCIYQKVK